MTTTTNTDRFARHQRTRHFNEDAKPTAGSSRRARVAARRMKRADRKARRRALAVTE